MKYFLLLAISVLMSGCTTALWHPEYYIDEISGIYTTENKDILYAKGNDHMYVFPMTEDLKGIFELSEEHKLRIQLNDFALNNDNQITGVIELYLEEKFPDSAPPKDLVNMGFEVWNQEAPVSPNQGEIIDWYRLLVEVEGERYESIGTFPFEEFDEPLRLALALPIAGSDKTKKMLLTPGAVAYDGAVVVPVTLIIFTAISLTGD